MPRNSPPKHRHDGTSPLPLGMDWCPHPKKWDGRNTTWPHDPHSGWSYCVMIPSWKIQTESGISNEDFLNPAVFYRIHVGVQSPEGFSTSHLILRRFSDFLKLFSVLKKAYPKIGIPPAPPKHAFLRINSSRLLLEERRHALEDWMRKLLCNIELSRSATVAAFLELEAAARSAFQDTNHPLEPSSSGDASDAHNSTHASKPRSVTSDHSSDNAYEASDLHTPRHGKVHISEIGETTSELYQDPTVELYQDPTVPLGATNNGVLMDDLIFNNPEDSLMFMLNHKRDDLFIDRDDSCGSSTKETFQPRDKIQSLGQDHDKLFSHARKVSSESIESGISSTRGSELSLPLDLPGRSESPNALEVQFFNDVQIVLPFDQRPKLNRVFVTMQRRLMTAKTDMEDLIARLNQEKAVKEYLSTKVTDLEVELEVTKQKSKENLHQTLMIERERVTQMQWDMDELRRKYMQMESKLIFEQSEKIRAESENISTSDEKVLLFQELNSKHELIDNLRKQLEDLEMKSKADKKVLVKEVKSLRNSQAELKEMLSQCLKEKTEIERILQNEKLRSKNVKSTRKKILNECVILRRRLQECSVNFLAEGEDKFIAKSSLSDALDLLETSDNRIGLLLAEAQLLPWDDESSEDGDDSIDTEGDLRRMLADTFVDNANLRRQVNSAMRCALMTVVRPEENGNVDAPSRSTVLNRFLER